MGYEEIEGQCGTCKFAAEIGYGPSPSGPEDGVHCTSLEHAKWMDEQNNPEDPNDTLYNLNQKELDEYGFVDLFRIEAVAGPAYRCPQWEPNEKWLARQTPPQPAGH